MRPNPIRDARLAVAIPDGYAGFVQPRSGLAARHGIEISARRVRRVLDTVEEEEKGMSVWRRVLEQTTGALLRQSGEAEAASGGGRPGPSPDPSA